MSPRVPRGRRGLVAAAVLVVLAAAPLFLAPFATTTLTRILVFALFAVSLDLLVGVTGLPSLGHAAYFGSGAYAAGWVSINVTAEAPVPLLVGAAVGAVAAALTGWITVRTGGVFFLMLTLAIGETVQQVANTWESVTGGANGLTGVPAVRVGGAPLANAGFVYWYVLAVFVWASCWCGSWPGHRSGPPCAASATTSRGCARSATRQRCTSTASS
jgi:branched-chain amino acid transport system permease protein